MEVDHWSGALAPKIAGTRNLHDTFGGNVDFFICLSSIVALRGNSGQTNYAAACSYQDALTRHRAALGLPAFSINVGPVLEVGFVSENPVVEAALKSQGLGTVSLGEVLALLGYAVLNQRSRDPVCAVGMVSTGVDSGRDVGMGWSLFQRVARRDTQAHKVEDGAVDTTRLLADAATFADAVGVVCDAILAQLGKLIATPVEALSASQGLDSYGVDSLVAVELRNWIGAHLQAGVQLMVLRGTGSILELAKIVAKESRLVGCKDA